jgi:hypothetical protein
MADRGLPQYDDRPFLAAREMSSSACGTTFWIPAARLCARRVGKQDLPLTAASAQSGHLSQANDLNS